MLGVANVTKAPDPDVASAVMSLTGPMAGGVVSEPNGETFSGRYLQVTADSSAETLDPYWGDWGVGWAGWGPWSDDYGPWIVGEDLPTFVRNYSGKVIATLLGDRGGRMRCRFRLAEPTQGMSSGGVGECEVSGGGKQTVRLPAK